MRSRSWGTLLCLLALLAVTLVPAAQAKDDADQVDQSSTGSAEAAPPWSYDPNATYAEGDILARMSIEDVDRDEAIRRYRVEDAVAGVLEPAIEALWPGTFAGLWITTPPKEFGVSVAFTSDAEMNVAELRELFPFPADLRGVQSAMPLRELLSIQRTMLDDRTDLQNGVVRSDLPALITATQGHYGLGTDVPTNNLVVSVEQASDELRDAFRSTYTRRIILREGVSQPKACTRADCRYAMMGGLELKKPDGIRCSSAFSARHEADSSARYVISAAHCDNDWRLNGGEIYGYPEAEAFGGRVDAERIRKAANVDWRESGKFVVMGETNPRSVENYQVISDANVGVLVGMTGALLGTTRGYITDVHVEPPFVPGGWDFVDANMCSGGGDSGGSIFRNNTAWGILSGGGFGDGCYDADGEWVTGIPDRGSTTFGRIDVALDVLNLKLQTNNLRPQGYPTVTCDHLLCHFSKGTSVDWDGSITSYAWNFGDGATSSAQNPTHTYASPGLYTATLTTTDNNGATRERSLTLDLKMYPPTLDSVTQTAFGVCALTLEWTAPSSGLDPDRYHIWRGLAETGTSWGQIATVDAFPTSFTDTTVGTGTTYWYAIKSGFETWRSIASNKMSASTGLCI